MKKTLAVRILGVIICLFIINLVWSSSPLGFSSAYAQSNNCGAYVAPGVWKEFDCYNLAAIGKTTNDDPFTPSWRLIGGYWQWGRKGPNPSKWYDTNTQHFAHGPTREQERGANSKPIKTWHEGRKLRGAVGANAWSDKNKTKYDPCPRGFRIPNKKLWEGVLDNNTISRVGTWSESATNYSSALLLGNSLMLPAAGYRHGSRDFVVYWSWGTGELLERGRKGYYWSSSADTALLSDDSHHLYFAKRKTVTSLAHRSTGLSVRCVAN
jgi:uncharacterized protein (TIGR02145 family)